MYLRDGPEVLARLSDLPSSRHIFRLYPWYTLSIYGWKGLWQNRAFFGEPIIIHFFCWVIITTPPPKKIPKFLSELKPQPSNGFLKNIFWGNNDLRPKEKKICTHKRRLYSVSKIIVSGIVPLSPPNQYMFGQFVIGVSFL